MSLHFDSVLPALMGIVSRSPLFQEGMEKICVIRDLRGCLRLVLQLKESTKRGSEIPDLEKELRGQLGSWFQGPILTNCADESARKHTAEVLMKRACQQEIGWPPHWPQEVEGDLGAKRPIDRDRWCSLERVQSKETWLSRTSGIPPWELERGKPAIVSFYSFKGGVGRTTCMGIIAYQLAKMGKKVVCVDLDLEAPGVADVLGMSMPELGLMDYLLSSLVGEGTATLQPSDICKQVELHGVPVWVVPAGKSDAVAYVEKLARLDYLSGIDLAGETQSPVAKGMTNLLRAIKGQEKPDFVFLDCRAGFHDLGGLGLHDLAHVEVLVGRASLQTRHGLEVILALQKQRRKEQQRRICLVHTFASADKDERAGQHERWRGQLYELFQANQMYSGASEIPQEADDQAAHFPWTIEFNQSVGYAASLADADLRLLLEDPDSSYARLRRRVEELCEAEQPADGEVGR